MVYKNPNWYCSIRFTFFCILKNKNKSRSVQGLGKSLPCVFFHIQTMIILFSTFSLDKTLQELAPPSLAPSCCEGLLCEATRVVMYEIFGKLECFECLCNSLQFMRNEIPNKKCGCILDILTVIQVFFIYIYIYSYLMILEYNYCQIVSIAPLSTVLGFGS